MTIYRKSEKEWSLEIIDKLCCKYSYNADGDIERDKVEIKRIQGKV